MGIAKVEPLLSTRNVRGPFDYRLPASMAGVGVGSVLVVPFGRRRVLGVVVGLAERSELPDGRLAEPLEALDAGVPPMLVALGEWIAEEYCSTPARGIGLVLPAGMSAGAEARRVRPLVELEAEITGAGRAALDGGERLGIRQRSTLRALLGGPRTSRSLAAAAGADRAALRRLEARGLLATREVERRRRPPAESIGARMPGIRLNDAQRAALDAIIGRRDPVRPRPTPGSGESGATESGVVGMQSPSSFLLHGVTGSGKTEVYLEAVRATIERGRGAIVLVPEIGLTPQTVTRFRERFSEQVAVLHSKLSPGARYDEWRRLRAGEALVCVGPRSAVFAPIADLGLIVIDEEHDSSYKQESDPRYDAREVARRRAAAEGATLIAGTATPRPETWLEMPHLCLPERVDAQRLPPVEILDMRGAHAGPLHPRTLAAFGELVAARGKAIVLINRRGWSTHLTCRVCGHDWRCPDCDVSLVLHRPAGRLRCHHCGHAEGLASICPGCDSAAIAQVGAGTQRVSSELESLLDPLPVFRLDSDSAAARGHHAAILRDFERSESGVLVGTQMVAKGHDFPDVTLSVILDADAGLRLPDFRAEERTFALITQLAGRCGRGPAGGRVLVQALAVGAPSVRHAANHDAAGFLAGELERRRALGYPPFSHLIEVSLAAQDEGRLDAGATALRKRLGAGLEGKAELLGPAPVFRLRGRHRRRFVIKSAERAPAVDAVRSAVEAATGARELAQVAISVDVDPQ